MLLYYISQTSVEYFQVLMKLIASRAAALLTLLWLLENKVFFRINNLKTAPLICVWNIYVCYAFSKSFYHLSSNCQSHRMSGMHKSIGLCGRHAAKLSFEYHRIFIQCAIIICLHNFCARRLQQQSESKFSGCLIFQRTGDIS